jgi:hypothetical protein
MPTPTPAPTHPATIPHPPNTNNRMSPPKNTKGPTTTEIKETRMEMLMRKVVLLMRRKVAIGRKERRRKVYVKAESGGYFLRRMRRGWR